MGDVDVPDDLKRILGPNEQVLLQVRQKIYHPQLSIDSIAVTNERVILRHPHTLRLRQNYTDYNYQDISNVILDKGVLRSTIKFTLRMGGEALALADIPNSEAEKAYGMIRENLVRFQAPYAAGYAGIPAYQQTPPSPSAALRGACTKCGAPLSPGQRFCGSCGAPVA